MMLIAILLIACFVGYKVVTCWGCGGVRPAAGFMLKTLGVVAMVAGLGVLLTRSGDHEDVEIRQAHLHDEIHGELSRLRDELRSDLSNLREEITGELSFDHEFDRGDFAGPLAERKMQESTPHRGLLIVLGSGLIILGAILFGRERTRPFALKAITFLGVGAIIFSVANYFSDPPRAERMAQRTIRDVRRDTREHEVRIPTKVARTTRARRPSMRPDRPAPGATAAVELPPRAGEIPVFVEVASDVAKDVEIEVAVAAEKDSPPPAETAPKTETPAVPSIPETPPAVAEAEPAPAVPEAAKPEPAAVKSANPEPAPVAAPADAPAVAKPTGEARPPWVDAPHGLKGDVYSLTINSGPWSSVPECQHALDDELQKAANQYINDYLGDEQAATLVNIPLRYLKRNVKKAEFVEIVDSPSVGSMYQLHARLDFNDQTRADFQRLWRNAVVQDRLWYTGGGAALVLALLATFYGYLRLDLKTDSAHKGRLQLAATLVALIVAAGALLARWAVPF